MNCTFACGVWGVDITSIIPNAEEIVSEHATLRCGDMPESWYGPSGALRPGMKNLLERPSVWEETTGAPPTLGEDVMEHAGEIIQHRHLDNVIAEMGKHGIVAGGGPPAVRLVGPRGLSCPVLWTFTHCWDDILVESLGGLSRDGVDASTVLIGYGIVALPGLIGDGFKPHPTFCEKANLYLWVEGDG